MTSTSSVVTPLCTSTLSITTWKNSGLTMPKICSTKEISSTSPSSLRYFTRAGTNQQKSNLASSPARLARLLIKTSCPVQCSAKASSGSIVGPTAAADGTLVLPPPVEGCGSDNKTLCPSHWARITTRSSPAGHALSRTKAKAGNGASARRSLVVRTSLALSPSCRAPRNRSSTLACALGGKPN